MEMSQAILARLPRSLSFPWINHVTNHATYSICDMHCPVVATGKLRIISPRAVGVLCAIVSDGMGGTYGERLWRYDMALDYDSPQQVVVCHRTA